MDLASFIATVTDPRLRQEIFAGMDEATLATLPPNLLAEARRINEQVRFDQGRARNNLGRMMYEEALGIGGRERNEWGDMLFFGRRPPAGDQPAQVSPDLTLE